MNAKGGFVMFLKVRDTMVDSESVSFVKRFTVEEAQKLQYGIRVGLKNTNSVVNMLFDTEAESKKYYDQLGSMLETVNLN